MDGDVILKRIKQLYSDFVTDFFTLSRIGIIHIHIIRLHNDRIVNQSLIMVYLALRRRLSKSSVVNLYRKLKEARLTLPKLRSHTYPIARK